MQILLWRLVWLWHQNTYSCCQQTIDLLPVLLLWTECGTRNLLMTIGVRCVYDTEVKQEAVLSIWLQQHTRTVSGSKIINIIIIIIISAMYRSCINLLGEWVTPKHISRSWHSSASNISKSSTYNCRLIESRVWSIKWCRLQWSWVTTNSDVKACHYLTFSMLEMVQDRAIVTVKH